MTEKEACKITACKANEDWTSVTSIPPLLLYCAQVFRRNMTEKEACKITACKANEDWTSVTFKPDLAKFGMQHLEADTVALMRKRVYDLAGVLGRSCKVRRVRSVARSVTWLGKVLPGF